MSNVQYDIQLNIPKGNVASQLGAIENQVDSRFRAAGPRIGNNFGSGFGRAFSAAISAVSVGAIFNIAKNAVAVF